MLHLTVACLPISATQRYIDVKRSSKIEGKSGSKIHRRAVTRFHPPFCLFSISPDPARFFHRPTPSELRTLA